MNSTRFHRAPLWCCAVLVLGATVGLAQVIDIGTFGAKLVIQNSLDLAVFRQTLTDVRFEAAVTSELMRGGRCDRLQFRPIAAGTGRQVVYEASALLDGGGPPRTVRAIYFHAGHPHMVGDQVITTASPAVSLLQSQGAEAFVSTLIEYQHLKAVLFARDPAIANALGAAASGPGIGSLQVRSKSGTGGQTWVTLTIYSRVAGHVKRLFSVVATYGAGGQLVTPLQIAP